MNVQLPATPPPPPPVEPQQPVEPKRKRSKALPALVIGVFVAVIFGIALAVSVDGGDTENTPVAAEDPETTEAPADDEPAVSDEPPAISEPEPPSTTTTAPQSSTSAPPSGTPGKTDLKPRSPLSSSSPRTTTPRQTRT
jgi:hypothetical protein